MRTGYTYDDILLIPQYSEVESRDNIDVGVDVKGGLRYLHPIIPANMLDIATEKMHLAIRDLGGMFIYHRFKPEVDLLAFHQSHPETWSSVGKYSPENVELVNKLFDQGQSKFCVDLAHGGSKSAGDMVDFIRKKSDKNLIIAGNVVTGGAAQYLIDRGADIIKVGVGPGSICTTRVVTGHGFPQFSALMEIRNDVGPNVLLIADGGIKNSGDIVKALTFADFVMVGNLLAGVDESGGYRRGGKHSKDEKYQSKSYDGSSTNKDKYIEGVKAFVKFDSRGAKKVILSLLEGVRSGLSYGGAKSLHDFRRTRHDFVVITSNGLRESYPHDLLPK